MLPKIEDVIALVKTQLGLKNVGENDHFVEALGAESADVVNVVVATEIKYNIEIDESELSTLSTASGLHALIIQQLQSKS